MRGRRGNSEQDKYNLGSVNLGNYFSQNTSNTNSGDKSMTDFTTSWLSNIFNPSSTGTNTSKSSGFSLGNIFPSNNNAKYMSAISQPNLGVIGNSNGGNPDLSFGQKLGFTNANGSLNLGGIGQGLDILGSLFGAYKGLQEMNMAKEQFDINKKLTLDNQANQIAISQADLDALFRMRAADMPNSAYANGTANAPVLQNQLAQYK